MSNLFQIPVKVPKRNRFDLSHDFKASGKMGRLIPVLAVDCIPGDSFAIGINSAFRFLPLVADVMHKVKVKTSFFFVPNRILCPTWEKFILADEAGEETIAVPTITWQPIDQFAAFTVGGYMGLPGLPGGVNSIEVSAYPFAAYERIYQEYYRPQQLEPSLLQDLTPGNTNTWASDIAEGGPKFNNWALDYFTAAQPYPQWGAESVRIPVGGQAVIYDTDSAGQGQFRDTHGVLISEAGNVRVDDDGLTLVDRGFDPTTYGAYDPNGTLTTDPETAGTINDLLRASALQRWLNRTARAGNRYVEQIKAFFGVPVQDSRLQRPEFIGTVRQTVAFSPVLSTAETDAPLGQIAGQGVSKSDSGKMYYNCKEHGWIIGLLTVMPTSAYQDGVPRKFLRFDRYDYPWPDFANIGEQPVYNAEIYADIPVGTGTNQQLGTWGYQSRYAECKLENSRVAGLLRGELDVWHLGRKFQDLPPLNRQFVQTIEDSATFARIFADLDGEHFVFQMWFDLNVKRALPRFGIPAI